MWFTYPVFLTAAVGQRLLGSTRERRSGVWTERLRYRVFLHSLPAILVVTAAIAAATMHYLSRGSLPSTYANRAEAALRAKEYDLAALCLHRLLSIYPDDRRLQFYLATAYAGRGDVESAVALMRTLSPGDDIGYPPAQLWMVRRTLTLPGRLSPPELRELESRLIRLRTMPELGDEAAVLLADLYFRTGRAKMVLEEPTLAAAAESTPELRLRLIQARGLYRSLNENAAQLHADTVQLAAQFRRDLDDHPDDVPTRLRLAESLLLLEDFDGAEVVLREGLTLATGSEQLGAALVQAACGRVDQAVVRGLPAADVQARAKSARTVVERYARAGDPKSLATAKLLALAGDVDAAIPLYEKLLSKSPLIRMELAEILRRAGREDEAKTHYAAIVAGTDPNKPPSEQSLRLAYGTAQWRLEQFNVARAWFEPLAAESPTAKQLLVEMLVAWSDGLPATDTKQRLELLRETLRRSPQALEAWDRMLKLSVGDSPTAAAARRTLADMIADGEAGADAYALLGTHALQQQDEASALKYLEQAERLNPQSGAILNNLAWLLAFGRNSDLKRALMLANAAVLKFPDDQRLRDTRGRILAKLERWDEALADLEKCRQAYDADSTYHHTLAEVYDQLGLEAPAEAHRRRERELKAVKASLPGN